MSKLKRAMLIQPMKGKTDEEIKETRDKATQVLEEAGYEIVDTYFNDAYGLKEQLVADGVIHIPVRFLSYSLHMMSMADLVYCCDGWNGHTGCELEHRVARLYGIQLAYEGVTFK